MKIDNVDGSPSTMDDVKRVARGVSRAALWAYRQAKDFVWNVSSLIAPVALTCFGVLVLQGWKSHAQFMGSDAVWWMGVTAVGFGLSSTYGRGVDEGKSQGAIAMAREVAGRVKDLAERKTNIIVEHKLNIVGGVGHVTEGHKIIEASETLEGQLALTIEWPNGQETVEIVSQEAAARLGYRYPAEA